MRTEVEKLFRSEPLPLWLRIEMDASELFERWRFQVCGAVSWFGYDGPGGEYEYWPDGPDAPSASEEPPFDNVAVFGDNDFMFHRVGAIGTPADPAADAEWVRLLERQYPLPSFAAR